MGNCYTCKHFIRTPFCIACKYQNNEIIENMEAECPYYKISFFVRVFKFLNPEKNIEYSENIKKQKRKIK